MTIAMGAKRDACEGQQGNTYWLTVRIIVSVLLLASAFLKAFSPAESIMLEGVYNLPRWLVLLTVQVEVLLAAALLSNFRPRLMRNAAFVLFLLFACFSVYRALGGAESCGCFGSLKVNPWLTFAVDAGVLLLVGAARPISKAALPSTRSEALATLTYFLVGPACLVAMLFQSGKTPGSELLPEVGGLTLLEPKEWVGEPFPLTEYITPAKPIQKGEWTIVLYHHDCPKCQEAKPQYEELAKTDGRANVILVEVPPYGAPLQPPSDSGIYCRLVDEREWFVQAPVEIRIRNGVVALASLELPSVWDHADSRAPN